MKNFILVLSVLGGLMACNSDHSQHQNHSNESKTATPKTSAEAVSKPDTLYICPMHADITGKKGDICSKCNMDLEPKSK